MDGAEYAVVKCEMQYDIWPTARTLPLGYSYAGPVGTRAEMQSLLSQQFVETTAATYRSNGGIVETSWIL
jgi:uncharacterized protein YbdZ (MbtH family)